MMNKLPGTNFLCSALLLVAAAGSTVSAQNGDNPVTTIRIMTVVIIQQEDFLQWLLEPYLNEHNIKIEYSAGLHDDVAKAAEAGTVDLAIAHTKVKSLRDLATNGIVNKGRPVFANPMAFLGPAGDPAAIKGMSDPVLAMRQILTKGICYVINNQGRLAVYQKNLVVQANVPGRCVIDEDQYAKLTALDTAYEKGAYTMWGLHPYTRKSDRKLEPIVMADGDMLHSLSGYVVTGSGVVTEATALLDYLRSDATQQRLTEFRLSAYKDIQPWWPAKLANDRHTSDSMGKGDGSGQGKKQ